MLNPLSLLIADVDGVMMDNSQRAHLIPQNGGNHTRDWERFNNACLGDTPIQHMIDLVNYLQATHAVAICTGRSVSCRHDTLQSLADAGLKLAKAMLPAIGFIPEIVVQTTVWMRQMDDHRRGHELKLDGIQQLISFHRPSDVLILEDDPTIIKAIRETSWPCPVQVIQVAPHNGCAAVQRHQLPPAAHPLPPLPSLQEVRDDLAEYLVNAREDRTLEEAGLAAALDYLDEVLGTPPDRPHSDRIAGWERQEDGPQSAVAAAADGLTQVAIER